LLKRTLIFDAGQLGRRLWCAVIDLCQRGYLTSLLDDGAAIARACRSGGNGSGAATQPSPQFRVEAQGFGERMLKSAFRCARDTQLPFFKSVMLEFRR
jgi:hypothetical protein